MRKIFLVLVSIFAAVNVRAEDMAGRFGLGGTAGAVFPIGAQWVNDRHDPGLALGGWMHYEITRRWGARLSYDNLRLSRGPVRAEPLMLAGTYALFPESAWNPHFRLGVGPSFIKGDQTSSRRTLFGYSAGISVDRFLTRHLSIGGALDYFGAAKKSPARSDVHLIRAGITAGLWFGGRSAAPVVQAEPARPAAPAPTPAPTPMPVSQSPAVAVSVSPASAQLGPEAKQAFEASVSGPGNKGVVWSIDPALGSISSNGVYTAPTVIAAPQTVNVIATSLADKAKSTMAQVQLVPPQKVEVRMDIGFDTAKDVIAPQYDGELKKVAEFLKSYPTASAEIEGHTDNIGAVDYNRGLSQRRADSVRKALIEKFGIESARLTAKGYGPDRPVAGNDTAAGRAKNRRVVASFSAFKK